VMHGREARVPFDLLRSGKDWDLPKSVEEYRVEMSRALDDAWASARRNMEEVDRKQQWNTEPARHNVNVPQYELGEQMSILRKRAQRLTHKVAKAVWYGPYTIVRKVSDDVYVLNVDGKEDLVHADRLKRWTAGDMEAPIRRYQAMVDREADAREREVVEAQQGDAGAQAELSLYSEEEDIEVTGVVAGQPGEDVREVRLAPDQQDTHSMDGLPDGSVKSSEVPDGEEDFEVEAILAKRVIRNSSRLNPGKPDKVMYQVKWKGYPPSWEEDTERLSACRKMIEAFERQQRRHGDIY
jgi:hypothetical protein